MGRVAYWLSKWNFICFSNLKKNLNNVCKTGHVMYYQHFVHGLTFAESCLIMLYGSNVGAWKEGNPLMTLYRHYSVEHVKRRLWYFTKKAINIVNLQNLWWNTFSKYMNFDFWSGKTNVNRKSFIKLIFNYVLLGIMLTATLKVSSFSRCIYWNYVFL